MVVTVLAALESRSAKALQAIIVSLLPLASGWLLAASASDERRADLAWVALVPLALATFQPRLGVGGWCALAAAGAWFHFHGITWLRVTRSPVVQPDSWWWIVQAVYLGLSWPLAAIIARDLKRCWNLPCWAAFAAGWMGGEFARMHLSAIVDETGYPWLQLAGYQTHHPRLLQLADLGGAWLIGGVVAGGNAWWLDLVRWARGVWRQGSVRGVPARGVLAAAGLAAALLAYGQWRLAQPQAPPGPSARFMPNNLGANALPPLPSEARGNDSAAPADWLVWPEFALGDSLCPAPGAPRAERLSALADCAQTNSQGLIVGCGRREVAPPREFNSVVVVDPKTGTIGWYDKMALIPWQEFPPWIVWPGMNSVEQGFEHGSQASVHSLWSPSRGRTYRVAATVCYDTCFAWVHRRFFHGDAGPDVFVTCSAELLDDEHKGSRQILALARLRAVECRRALARCVFNGLSSVVDGNGAVRLQVDDRTAYAPVDTGPLPIDSRWSLYRVLGDWLPAAVLAAWLLTQVPGLRPSPGGQRERTPPELARA